MSIPKTIHHMWFDRQIYDNEAPPDKHPKYLEYIQSWKTKNPGFQFMFWNRRRIENLWTHPKLAPWKSFYDKFSKHIEKCDFTRYAILYIHGGWYNDLDFICLRDISPLLENREFLWTREPDIHKDSHDEGRTRIYNGLMASRSDHWIWPMLMTHIRDNYNPSNGPILNTGPSRLSIFSQKYQIQLRHPQYFVDKCLVIPLDVSNKVCAECPKDSLDRAYCFTRWCEGSNWWNQPSIK